MRWCCWASVKVDTRAPTAPTGLLATPQADGRFTVTWSNPGEQDGAPIVASHVAICPHDSTDACPVSGESPNTETTKAEGLVIPSATQGWDAVVW